MRLSVAIRHHPSRAHLLPDLLDRLGLAQIPMGDDLSRWGSGRRALLATAPGATHHMLIEDDAIVPRHLIVTVRKALEFVPAGHPVGLYLGTPDRDDWWLRDWIMDAESIGASWIQTTAPMSAVGVVFPTEHIPELVEWGDHDDETYFDGRIARWYVKEGISCWHTWPSLVNHRPDVPSISGKALGRLAACFIGQDARIFEPSGPQIDTT